MNLIGKEQLNELVATLSSNKLRTLLTGLAVGWGIMLLILLLSSGMGIQHGIEYNVLANGLNATGVRVDFGRLSEPYRGLPQYYEPQYSTSDCMQWLKALPEWIRAVAPFSSGYNIKISHEEKLISINLIGITPLYQDIKRLRLSERQGRFINDADLAQNRKVIILNKAVAEGLLLGSKPLGRTVYASGIAFTVIGICEDTSGIWGSNYIPLSTMQTLRLNSTNNRYKLDGAMLDVPSIRSDADEERFRDALRQVVAAQKGLNPKDTSILYFYSQATMLKTLDGVFSGIKAFLWIIGLSTLLIGLVGVINIMQITVTERRREIGIRKAIGAKRRDILSMIVLESICITLVAGLGGMVTGVALMATTDYIITLNNWGVQRVGNFESYIYINPTISPGMALGAVLVMIIGGAIAGYLPAQKALSVPTTEAMRQ